MFHVEHSENLLRLESDALPLVAIIKNTTNAPAPLKAPENIVFSIWEVFGRGIKLFHVEQFWSSLT